MGEQLKILEKLVVKQVAGSKSAVKSLTNDLHVRLFKSYLLRGWNGCTVERSEYEPYVLDTYSGEPYFRPDGWVQFWWEPQVKFSHIEDWPVAYHGTSLEKIPGILTNGLRKPGTFEGVAMSHGQAGAGRQGAIYVTPSLWLAAHPVYSTLAEVSTGRWVQFVSKVRVRPGSYKCQGNTLGLGHFAPDVMYDPNFPDGPPEWLVSRSCDVRIVGIMMRELGPHADNGKFGALVRRLSYNKEGVEYQWTSILQEALRSGGYVKEEGQVVVSGNGNSVVTWKLNFPPGGLGRLIAVDRKSACKPFYTCVSKSFAFGSIEDARLSFSPADREDDGSRCSTLQLHCPSKAHVEWKTISVLGDTGYYSEGPLCSEADVAIFGRVKSDTAKLVIKVLLACEIMGSISTSPGRAEWTLDRLASLLSDYPRDCSIRSPVFELGSLKQARLELYPNGQSKGGQKNYCSLYVWPGGVPIACRLTIGKQTRVLNTHLDTDTTHADASYGWPAFCSLDMMPKKASFTISLEHESDAEPPPVKRIKTA